MITVGTLAPDFNLLDQFGVMFSLRESRGRANVLILGYPADWTPTCSWEIPTMNGLADRFLAQTHTRIVALNADQRFCHNAWGASLGGISIPMLADAHPHGEVSRGYGIWLDGESQTDRATVIVDAQGVVRYAETVGKDGRRDPRVLLAECGKLANNVAWPVAAAAQVATPTRFVLYANDLCGLCQQTVFAVKNLKLEDRVRVVHVNRDPESMAELDREAAKHHRLSVVPSLLVDDGVKPDMVQGAGMVMAELSFQARGTKR